MNINWRENETGEVAQAFASFLDTWDEQKPIIIGDGCYDDDKEFFDMSANGVPFLLRRIGNKFALIFNGEAELIQESTFNSIKQFCLDCLEEGKKKYSQIGTSNIPIDVDESINK
ncbi:hypothetical protein [Acinetobacter nosocomialis]|uniref:hypothetical protein n=1 Tax=Acinetobacter nosocomialis TaxID=106654 RepID=UPI00125CD71D|nr:hypothetical protein [Acinetobacter nosocomialis]